MPCLITQTCTHTHTHIHAHICIRIHTHIRGAYTHTNTYSLSDLPEMAAVGQDMMPYIDFDSLGHELERVLRLTEGEALWLKRGMGEGRGEIEGGMVAGGGGTGYEILRRVGRYLMANMIRARPSSPFSEYLRNLRLAVPRFISFFFFSRLLFSFLFLFLSICEKFAWLCPGFFLLLFFSFLVFAFLFLFFFLSICEILAWLCPGFRSAVKLWPRCSAHAARFAETWS
jgi:hypothetical protein